MTLSFISLTLPKEDLIELHKGMLIRYILDAAMRREKGLEDIEYPENLVKLEEMLGINEEQAHALFHQLEDELWEYVWYTYTDEWAWHRAKKETDKELGDKTSGIKREALERLIEERYEKNFDKYVAEIDMKDEAGETEKRIERKKK
ncbi:hypothetical protein IT407_03185 [Candidatus Uhrbacteria bacterium]|nr:hypothetical protein [Candidatus Uhrbacteria bacterium]